jgi:NAD(P)-dependent dehydrogenase (short-subunit alcohol dehydrogenase family)
VDTLGLDVNLEADLGIDSLRRIQIADTLLTWLAGKGLRANDKMDEILQSRTLNQIVAAVLPATAVPQLPAKPEHEDATGTSHAACPRYIAQGTLRPLASGPEIALKGTVLITEDELGTAQRAIDLLRKRGIPALLLTRDILCDGDRVQDLLDGLSDPPRAVIHLSTLVRHSKPDYAEWRAAAQIQAKSLFQILRGCGRLFAVAGATSCRLVGATNMGGDFGRSGRATVTSPFGGAVAGLLKSVSLEWPGASVKPLDFGNDVAPADIARLVVAELLSDQDSGLEIGYPPEGRTVFASAAHAHPGRAGGSANTEPQPDWVILATGGARGITAEIALTLIRPGITVIVAGASPVNEDQSEIEDETPAVIRDRLIAAARQNGEIILPVTIEARLHDIVTARERRRTLRRLSAAGARVFYRQCDVRSPDEVNQLISWIDSNFGRLDAVLHGAGVIEDKLIAQKTQDSFDRVFDTKVDGAFLLARRIDAEKLKLFVLFGSVSGRFGNAGQADYAAANEVLNRLAWRLSSEWPRARVMCINWGPWMSSGMATDAVRARLAQRGIVPIETQAGCRFFAEELELGRREDVEVVAGEGPWIGSGAPLNEAADASTEIVLVSERKVI